MFTKDCLLGKRRLDQLSNSSNSTNELDFARDMGIDEQALDVEWLVTQGELAGRYNMHYAKMCKDLELAHEDVKTISSELIRRANKDPMKCCLKAKPNKEDLESYYRTHGKYKKAKAKMIDVEYEKNMAEMAKNEINFTRKAALENAVVLLGQQYFAGPRMPRNIHKESSKRREELNQRNQEKISKSMKRRSK